MPLADMFNARRKRREERWSAISKHRKVALAPLLKVIEADKDAMAAARARSRMKAPPRPKRRSRVGPNVTSPIRSGSILGLRLPPYDAIWTSGTGSSSGSNNYGEPLADINTGEFGVGCQVDSDSGSVSAEAGVGVWFQPVADNTIVRVAADCPGDVYWDTNSYLTGTAQNEGSIGLVSESWDLNGGDYKWGYTDQSSGDFYREITLWNDSVGWGEEHGFNNDSLVWFPNDTYSTLFAERWYRVWLYCWAACDGDGEGVIGSTADAYLGFQDYFFVFEQWT
jgi:hypothetical protein